MSDEKNIIRRFSTELDVKRAGDVETRKDEYIVRGYACKYESPSDAAGWYTETIKAGACDEAINVSDVKSLLNHDPNHLLARSKYGAGTLNLVSDSTGLYFEHTLPRSRADIVEMYQRGDIDQCSFAFTIDKHQWRTEGNGDEEKEYWDIIKVDRLFDVSIVVYPFYTSATFEIAEKTFRDYKNADHSALQAKAQKIKAERIAYEKRIYEAKIGLYL